jgi:hypothetical protein
MSKVRIYNLATRQLVTIDSNKTVLSSIQLPFSSSGETGREEKKVNPKISADAVTAFKTSLAKEVVAEVEIKSGRKYFIVKCPHCESEPILFLYQNELACKIFRHAAYNFDTNKLINPHTPEQECDRLSNEKLIVGCGKPFRVLVSDEDVNIIKVEKCGYL